MTMPSGTVRLGVLTDGDDVPYWMASALREVQERGLAEVVLIVERASAAPPAPQGTRMGRWWKNRKLLAFALAERLDRRRGPAAPAAASLRDIAPRAARLEVSPILGRFTDTFRDDDVAAVQRHDLDVLVRLGFRILKGAILGAARNGVWSFHHGDNRTNRGGPPGVWEVLEDRPETGVTLQRLSSELDGGEVLARGVGRTERFSFARNVGSLYPRSSRMLVRSVERLARGQPARQASAGDGEWHAYQHRLYRRPTNGELLRAGARLGVRYTRQRSRWRGRELTWSVAWHMASAKQGAVPHDVMHQYHELRPPADRFWADPFVVRDGDSMWMFFEELVFSNPVGRIAAWQMGPKGPIGDAAVVLERPYHLSYPFVFQWEGQWYMLPESQAALRLELYRATDFPRKWELDRVLLDPFNGVDATLYHHTDGRWYLFTSIADIGITHDEELHLFVGDSPFGPFMPHPENPLVADVRRARMAGRLFRHGTRLIRPAQCCAPLYGSGITMHVVEELSPTAYRERPVQHLGPTWDPRLLGLHTINAQDGLSVIDLLRLDRISR
ncbi:MAG TPA: hypothetical protein VFO96_05575 [Gemmatimonadales bacterium]|jgi:hypothetical protein|nr:hypothetical protein [Gemmatimonadales bacterium]